MHKPLLVTLFAAAFYFVSQTVPPPATSSSLAESANLKAAGMLTGGGRDDKAALTRENFYNVVNSLYDSIGLASYGLNESVFRKAMLGYHILAREGALKDKNLLTIIDFKKPSTEKRFYTIDLAARKVVFHTYVAHGRNTGDNRATSFSNIPHSNQSSLGFYITAETYVGSKGYSLRLDGKEKSFNDKIRSRAVVMHAADYATEAWIKRYGRLGRSQGCPALPPDLNRKVIDTIKGGTAIFTYYPDSTYLKDSRYLNEENLFRDLDQLSTSGVRI